MDLKKILFSRSSGDKSQLGLFWGKDSFSLTETAKGLPDKNITIRFDDPIPGDQGQKIPDNLRLTALLQQAIREKKILSQKVNVSLSTKDVIYRSFVIPYMLPNEVKNVVDFEATKYIPIKLDELAYTYHAIAFSDGEQKSLRILFVAARKTTLEKYCAILQQAGLETSFIEPASVSLVRILQKHGHIARQQATAIVEVENEGGRISVLDKDIIQFVREFQSSIEGNGIPAENAKFFNDIRVSFNFYQRQNTQAKLDRLVILANTDLSALADGLGQEFKVPATSVSISKIIKDQQSDLGALSAAGACIREPKASSKNFDLSIKSVRTGKNVGESKNIFANWNFKTLALGLGIAIALVIVTSFLTKSLITGAKQTSENLKKELGVYESSDQATLTELKTTLITKLNQYKDIRINSEITYFLKKIPHLLPKGAWLNSFSLEYYEVTENTETGPRKKNKISLSMDGQVYLPDTNEQLRQVNTFIEILKTNEDLKKHFTDITLANVKQGISDNYPVTSFRISCK